MSPQPAKPADIGRRYSHGQYAVTFVMDADECDNVGSTFAALGDSWADELFATADEIRRLEKIRNDPDPDDLGPGLSIIVTSKRVGAQS